VEPLLDYLQEDSPNNFDVKLEVDIAPYEHGPTTISRTNFRHMYYSMAQQLTHHALSGCLMETGDLLGSGTISGPTKDSFGSLLELTWNGQTPLEVAGGSRSFIEDYDTLTLRGWCEGAYRVGFGECSGRVLPALKDMF
jgi:fumarylacetoacetase